MLFSFESPLDLLEESFKFNDYEFILYHLINKYPAYKEYVKKSNSMNRLMIMDNSAYELGDDYDLNEYAECIKEFKPDYYILPDKFNNAQTTMTRSCEFLNKFPNLPCKPMGTIHGSTVDEMLNCYSFMNTITDAIAISFKLDVFKELANTEHELTDIRSKYDFDTKKSKMIWPDDMAYAIGRNRFIDLLSKHEEFDENKHYHLLGVNLPQEIVFYKNKPFIKSVDTSNPIVHGMLGIKYTKTGDLKKDIDIIYQTIGKPTVKMNDLMERKLTALELDDVKFNISGFKDNFRGTK